MTHGKVWVGVEAYGGIVTDVYLFKSLAEAEAWFEEYTGLKYGTLYDEHGHCVNEDYDQTKIIRADLP